VVLGVGCEPDRLGTVGVVEQAALAGASALVLKGAVDADGPAATTAKLVGVALLALEVDMAWGQLHSLLRTACSTTGGPQPAGAGDVPLGDLFALANAVAAMVGGPVTIEDAQSTVLAYSAHDVPVDEPRRLTILGRRVPDEWLARLQSDGVFRRLWSEPGVIRVDYEAEFGLRPRLAVAVRAGGEVLGSIWVAQGDTPLASAAESALAEAAQIAALHLIRQRSTEDLERRRRGDVLRAALDGTVQGVDAAAALGVGDDEPMAVLAFELLVGERAGAADLAVHGQRVVNLISLYCEAYRRQAVTTAAGRTVYVLVPLLSDAAALTLRSLAEDIVERTAEALRVPLRVGIGPVVSSVGDLPASRHAADQVLRILSRRPAAVAMADELRSELVLLRLQDLAAADPALANGVLTPLVEHDREHGTAYVDTLRAYLEAFGDVRRAAEVVAVHPNTFRYRIRRVGELSGIRLDDPTDRFIAELQLRLLDGM
jgi:hypothetical protein